MGCPAPSGVPRAPCPLTAPQLVPAAWGGSFLPPPAPYPLPRPEATLRGGCGQEGSHRGDFLTLPFARRLRATTYAAQEPQPAAWDPLPGAGAEGCQRGRRHGSRYHTGTGGLRRVRPSPAGHGDGAEHSLPTPGRDRGHGRSALGRLARRSGRGTGWGAWIYPQARRNGCVPQFPLHPSQEGLSPALEMLQAWPQGFTPGKMPREMCGKGMHGAGSCPAWGSH